MSDYTDVWNEHDLAGAALYEAIGSAEAEPSPTVRSLGVTDRAGSVVTTSSRLAEAAAEGLTARSRADRERSTLRLVAGAAADLAIAGDLLRSEEETGVGVRAAVGPTYSQLMSDLGPILEPGDELGLAPITRSAVAPVPESVDEAIAQLTSTATHSFDTIAGHVIALSKLVMNGLITVPVAQIHEAAAIAATEILNMLEEQIGAVIRRATQLLVQAYDKILKAIGQDLASQARQQAAQWIERLKSGNTIEQLLEQLYERQRILEDVEARAKQADGILLSDTFSAALSETQSLAEHFERQSQSLEWVLRGLNFVKERLLQLQPWGPLAVTAVYVGTVGYAVYAGGDYVDWFRTEQIEPLNRIPGLRGVVRDTLTSAEDSTEG